MFETSLVRKVRSGRRGWMLFLAVVTHVSVASALVLASVWNIPEVVPPTLMETVYVTLPPPLGDDTPARPPAKPPEPAPVKHEAAQPAQPPAVHPPELQPQTVPETVP